MLLVNLAIWPQTETLTGQHISHDGIPEKWDVVDDVPEALEVGEKVVDRVGRWLQGNFKPGEELSCKIKEGKMNYLITYHNKHELILDSPHVGFIHTYVLCSFVQNTPCARSHTRNYLVRALCKRPCSGMVLSNMGYLKQEVLGVYWELT